MGFCCCCCNDDGICSTKNAASQKVNSNNIIYGVSFRCTYIVRNLDEIQIINDRDEFSINEEIKSKIKILNNNKKEELIFRKKFNKIGLNIIDFIIEEKINNMSFMFNQCKTLKEIEFISMENALITNMKAIFQECNELEYLNLYDFNASNVTDMG